MKRNLQSAQLNQKFQHNFTSGRSILVVIQVLTVRMTSPDLNAPYLYIILRREDIRLELT